MWSIRVGVSKKLCCHKFITNNVQRGKTWWSIKVLCEKKVDSSFIKECISVADPNLSGTPCIHSVPNSLHRLPIVPLVPLVPSEGDSIKTDLRAGFMKTVRFSRQYFTDGGSFFLTRTTFNLFFFLFLSRPSKSLAPIITLPSRWRDYDNRSISYVQCI